MSSNKIENYERQVRRTISRYGLVRDGDCIHLGLSGGKDSAAAAYLVARYVERNHINCEVRAFHICLGEFIPQKVIDTVKSQAELCDVPIDIYNAEDMGADFTRLSQLKRPICSSCGTVKRYLMNKLPREQGATKMCTGHHADDLIVFFLKNVMGNNISWISKFTPLLKGGDKQLARIRPLFFVGGKQNRRYCETMQIPYLKADVCPHVFLKEKLDKRRAKWFQTVADIASWQPHFYENMMKGIASIATRLDDSSDEPDNCRVCGEPTSGETCAYCRLLQQMPDSEEATSSEVAATE